jgi:hypothetical protein
VVVGVAVAPVRSGSWRASTTLGCDSAEVIGDVDGGSFGCAGWERALTPDGQVNRRHRLTGLLVFLVSPCRWPWASLARCGLCRPMTRRRGNASTVGRSSQSVNSLEVKSACRGRCSRSRRRRVGSS